MPEEHETHLMIDRDKVITDIAKEALSFVIADIAMRIHMENKVESDNLCKLSAISILEIFLRQIREGMEEDYGMKQIYGKVINDPAKAN